MEKYLRSETIPIPKPFRWSWFVLGCGCLLLGTAYLSAANLSDGAIAAVPSGTLISADADQ